MLCKTILVYFFIKLIDSDLCVVKVLQLCLGLLVEAFHHQPQGLKVVKLIMEAHYHQSWQSLNT